MMNAKQFFRLIVITLAGSTFMVACSSSRPAAPAAQAEQVGHNEEAMHQEEDEGHSHAPDDHMAGAHDVPEDAAAVPNPIEANHESREAGEELFAINCAVCHGETGLGDGPGAAGLEKPPANLNAAHVQGLSDGALFYIISHGRPETPMPAWQNVLSEENRWQVVNYMRTFSEADTHAEEAHQEEDDHANDAADDEDHGEGEEDHEGNKD